ncbi:MAG: hyperosmotically inducible periplasmic protein [Blastocatellia bacterium]|nr:hyperosmotically inducible periplasmic protein [Blastocatellia bacterium]
MNSFLFQKLLFVVLMLNLAFAAFSAVPIAAMPVNSEAIQKKNQPVNDDIITDDVRLKLGGDPDVKGGAIQVDTKQGVVTLSGLVETANQKAKAGRVTKKVKGVKKVVNNLKVKQTRP